MSLDVTLTCKCCGSTVFDANITHNLNRMAEEAGIYDACWRPEEINVKVASDLVPLLERGLEALRSDPARFLPLEPDNKWGTYRDFVPWVENYLNACRQHPDAVVSASR